MYVTYMNVSTAGNLQTQAALLYVYFPLFLCLAVYTNFCPRWLIVFRHSRFFVSGVGNNLIGVVVESRAMQSNSSSSSLVRRFN